MSTDPADTPKLIEIGEGFHVRQEVDNIAWIDLGDCALVVDALEQPRLEQEVFQAIASTLGDKPVRYLLNTHTHGDHVALNRAFQRRFGTQIVNNRHGAIAPEGRWFEGPRRRVLMLPMPGCHTREDCVVWVPDDRALFVGDIFGWGLINLSVKLNDETAALLDQTYGRLIEFDAAVVIPGHGPLAATSHLERWLRYFHELIDQVRQAVEAGFSDKQVMEQVAPPEDMKDWWRFLAWKHEDSLEKVLRAVRKNRLGG